MGVGPRAAGVPLHAAGTESTARPTAHTPSARAARRDVEEPIEAHGHPRYLAQQGRRRLAPRADFRESGEVSARSVTYASIPVLVMVTMLTSACASAADPTLVAPPDVSSSASAAAIERTAARRPLDLDAVSELDARTDALAEGPAARASGALFEVRAPADWTLETGETWTQAKRDGTNAAIHVGRDDGSEQVVADAAEALGVTACSWSPANPVTVGVDARPCSALDGACTRDGSPVRVALLRDAPGHLLVLGAWQERSDGLAIFGSMRSLGPVTLDGVAACCAALRASAKSAPPNMTNIYLGAAAICAATSGDRTAIRALPSLIARTGAALPAACR